MGAWIALSGLVVEADMRVAFKRPLDGHIDGKSEIWRGDWFNLASRLVLKLYSTLSSLLD